MADSRRAAHTDDRKYESDNIPIEATEVYAIATSRSGTARRALTESIHCLGGCGENHSIRGCSGERAAVKLRRPLSVKEMLSATDVANPSTSPAEDAGT